MVGSGPGSPRAAALVLFGPHRGSDRPEDARPEPEPGPEPAAQRQQADGQTTTGNRLGEEPKPITLLIQHPVKPSSLSPPQPAPPLSLPLSSWYSELAASLCVLHKVADNPASAGDWLLSVRSALSSGQRLPCSLALVVAYLIITGQDDVCQLALSTSQAFAAADPCQVDYPHGCAPRWAHVSSSSFSNTEI